MAAARNRRRGDPNPVRVLVLTFNRTLAGYVRNLAERQIPGDEDVALEVETFGHWAMAAQHFPNVDSRQMTRALESLAQSLGALTPAYVVKEVEYLLGRFEPENLEQYVSTERTGRGNLPRVDRALRRRILDEVVYPYQAWKAREEVLDWNDLAIGMARQADPMRYDIVIIDESQDFSANQLRAIKHHLADEHAVTFLIDTVQRIYARGFTWTEAGFPVRPQRVYTLHANHRNTVEIATFAAGVLNGLPIEGDGVLPNLSAATTHGTKPTVLRGLYSRQLDWSLDQILTQIDLAEDSVAFLKPLGGAWFDSIKAGLGRLNIDFVDLSRAPEWPEGDGNVAISTFHSAKGLEFDHVFILGFNGENTPHPDESLDDEVFVLRRLLAVAVARARKTVTIGYKPGSESRLVRYFSPTSFNTVDL